MKIFNTFKILMFAISIIVIIALGIYYMPIAMIIYQLEKDEKEIVQMSIIEFKKQNYYKNVFYKKNEIEQLYKYLNNNKLILKENKFDSTSNTLSIDYLIQKLPDIQFYLNSLKPIEIKYLQLCTNNDKGIIINIKTKSYKETEWCYVRHEIYCDCPFLNSYQLNSPNGTLAKDTTILNKLRYGIKIIPHTL